MSQQLISQIERGVNFTTRKLPQIAHALGRTVYDLDESYRPEYAPDVYVSAPLISWVAAGELVTPDIVPDVEDAPRVIEHGLDPNGDWIALRVDGDSMNRVSPHDSIIFVNRNERSLVPNGFYVIGDGEGGATYKRFRPPNTWEPHSNNPDHKPFTLPSGQEPHIVGRVRKTSTTL